MGYKRKFTTNNVPVYSKLGLKVIKLIGKIKIQNENTKKVKKE